MCICIMHSVPFTQHVSTHTLCIKRQPVNGRPMATHVTSVMLYRCHKTMFYNCHITWSHYVWACVIPYLLDQATSGVSSEEPRWKTCVSITHRTFTMAVGRMFVDRYFDKTAKLTVSSGRCVCHKSTRLWLDGWQVIDDSYGSSVFNNS